MSQTKAQLVSGTSAQDLTVDNIVTTSVNDGALSNRNLLHNSSFEVWQRGTAFASGASGGNRYTADRWSVPRRTRAAQSTDVPAGFKYALLLDREQTGGAEPFTVSQGIEADNIRFTGSYTLSFYAKSSDISTVNINVQDRTTVSEGGTSHSSIVTNQAVSITSSWARYTHTFTLSSIALSGTCLRISIGNTSASQNDELLLTGIQLETGSVATDIEKRSLGQELALCQRYFQFIGKEGTNAGVAAGFTTTTNFYGYGCLPGGRMRAAPTIAVSGTLSHLSYTHTAVTSTANNLQNLGSARDTYVIQITGNTSTTGNAGAYARIENASSALTFSSEL
jgi:hypothetical protein